MGLANCIQLAKLSPFPVLFGLWAENEFYIFVLFIYLLLFFVYGGSRVLTQGLVLAR
jgi:hypothetical protein